MQSISRTNLIKNTFTSLPKLNQTKLTFTPLQVLRSSNQFNLYSSKQSNFRSMSTSTTSTISNPWAEPLTKDIDSLGIYLAVIPDFVEGSKRMEVRPLHMEHAAVGHDVGWIGKFNSLF